MLPCIFLMSSEDETQVSKLTRQTLYQLSSFQPGVKATGVHKVHSSIMSHSVCACTTVSAWSLSGQCLNFPKTFPLPMAHSSILRCSIVIHQVSSSDDQFSLDLMCSFICIDTMVSVAHSHARVNYGYLVGSLGAFMCFLRALGLH